jgi:hypothetical protein
MRDVIASAHLYFNLVITRASSYERNKMKLAIALGITVSLFGIFSAARADTISLPTDIYFIGRDITPKVISGAPVDPDFVGLDNPNYNRLTFLYAHWVAMEYPASNANHYHGLSRYEYYKNDSGEPIISTHQVDGNVIPGVSDMSADALKMRSGNGVYEGKLVSYQYAEDIDVSGHYSNQITRGTTYLGNTSLFPSGSAQNRLYNGNYGKYTGSLDGSNIALELVSITPGLHVGIRDDIDVFDGGMTSVGLGDASDPNWQFTPVFWVDADAPLQNYTAVFRLKDLNSAVTGYLDSGEYGMTFTPVSAPVPEPASLALLACGATALLLHRRNKISAPAAGSIPVAR